VREGHIVDLSKILAMRVTGYTEWLSEPGDAFIENNRVKFRADMIDGGDNMNSMELRYMIGKRATSGAFNLVIVENTEPTPVYGNSKADNLIGTNLNDILCGNGGKDKLSGGLGNDTIDGGVGNDRISGGADNDTLTGFVGKDTFVFETGGGDDTITDYEMLVDRVMYDGEVKAWGDLRGLSVDTTDGAVIDFDGVAGNDVLLRGFHF
jgi:Ca2+-binding RTX toxin-like protein